MTTDSDLEIFLVTVPGLERLLVQEAAEKGFKQPKAGRGGVTVFGDWAEVWRANLELRGASKVLVRIGAFRVHHLAQLDKRARKFPWSDFLRADVPVRVEASCKKSKIYHSGAAAQRIENAVRDALGAPVEPGADIVIKARIQNDLCTLSIDTSGEGLHKRGHKEAVNKAPLRETLAALFLRQCGYDGNEPLVDPMCGSGTFVIEAAEIAANLKPGRSRRFAFEQLATFNEQAWTQMCEAGVTKIPASRFFGFDRDAGAIRMSQANAKRAGVEGFTEFRQQPVSELAPPCEEPGLVIVNPPYGARIGDAKKLKPLYQALGQTLTARFCGWRFGLVTATESLANATGLPFAHESAPVSHGGLRVKVYVTGPLA